MKIYHYLRVTQDWESVEDYDDLWFHNRRFVEILKAYWDSIIGTSWFEYRRKVKDIAVKSWPLPVLRASTDDVVDLIEDDDLILPTDDDDWVLPDIGRIVKRAFGHADFGTWNCLVNQSAFHHSVHLWHRLHFPICTNAYVVRGSFLKSLTPEQRFNLLMFHERAGAVVKEAGSSVVERKDLVLSCYNWHIGSHSVISGIKDTESAFRVLPKNEPKPVPRQWNWISGLRNELNDVIAGLDVRWPMRDLKQL